MGEAGRRVARLGSLADRPEDLSSPQRHTFRVPPIPKAGFDGIVVRCQVLECEPPSRLAYSWSAGPIIDTQVSYRLEPDGDGARVFFEPSGFDLSQPWANRLSEEPSLVGRKCSSGFPAWSGALRGVKAAKSETSVEKFKSRQQWLSQPLAGFAFTNQSGRLDSNQRPHGPEPQAQLATPCKIAAFPVSGLSGFPALQGFP